MPDGGPHSLLCLLGACGGAVNLPPPLRDTARMLRLQKRIINAADQMSGRLLEDGPFRARNGPIFETGSAPTITASIPTRMARQLIRRQLEAGPSGCIGLEISSTRSNFTPRQDYFLWAMAWLPNLTLLRSD